MTDKGRLEHWQRWCLACLLLCFLLLGNSAWSQALEGGAPTVSCTPQMQGAWFAKEVAAGQRPVQGWEPVSIPDSWNERLGNWRGTGWYRLDWLIPCPQEHWALAISGIRLAGAVFWNEQLLWRDRHMSGTYSRSGNRPRWWSVDTSQRAGTHTVWVRVAGYGVGTSGLGYVNVNSHDAIRDQHEFRELRQRTGFMLTAAMSATLGCIALMVWLWRRTERTYLWFGLMQLLWMVYLAGLLHSEPLWGLNNLLQSLLSASCFVLYAQSFWMFSLRYMHLHWPRLEKFTWGMTALVTVCAFLPAFNHSQTVINIFFGWGSVLVNVSCVLVIVRSLQTRQSNHLWMACCWIVILIIALHDVTVPHNVWDYDQAWSALFGPITTLFLAGLMGWQVAAHMRRIDSFNVELQQRVHQAREELSKVLAQQHAQELVHAKLQERVHLAHDLHDGLGGSLVRSLALVEQAEPQLAKDRVLSMLKVLRDDLRQLIDVGSSREITVPESPVMWFAPLRYRFTMILDELGISASWRVENDWKRPPTALQCMAMARVLEEAFSNVLKHSQTKTLALECTQSNDGDWRVTLQDDGVGFDVPAVQSAGMGVGMQSMQSRMRRVGGQLHILSSRKGTCLQAIIPVPLP